MKDKDREKIIQNTLEIKELLKEDYEERKTGKMFYEEAEKNLNDILDLLNKEEGDDEVEVTCYNQTRKMKRSEAMKKYEEGMMCSEGSERDRYTSVYFGLKNGCTKVDDDWKWEMEE